MYNCTLRLFPNVSLCYQLGRLMQTGLEVSLLSSAPTPAELAAPIQTMRETQQKGKGKGVQGHLVEFTFHSFFLLLTPSLPLQRLPWQKKPGRTIPSEHLLCWWDEMSSVPLSSCCPPATPCRRMAGGSPSPASPAGTPSAQQLTVIPMGTAPALQAEPGLSPQPSKGRSLKHTSTNTSSVLCPATECTGVQCSAITINTHNEKQEYSKPKGITYPNPNPFKHPFWWAPSEQSLPKHLLLKNKALQWKYASFCNVIIYGGLRFWDKMIKRLQSQLRVLD